MSFRGFRGGTAFSVPNFYTLSLHKGLRLGNGMLAEVEDGGRQYRIGATLGYAIRQVLQLTHPA